MAKRKPNVEETHEIIDLVSPISEVCRDKIKSHRSCWLHAVASVSGNNMRQTKQELYNLKHLERTAPCFLGTMYTRVRSKKKSKLKENEVISQKKKLDTSQFQCYLEHLWRRFSEDTKISCAYLDCLWFALYLEASYKAKVLTWIKKKQIFSQKYVFVPIVCWGHWSLLILCHFGESSESKDRTPCMLLLDSLETADPKRLEPNIRKFVLDIYKAEGRFANKQSISTIPLKVPKVPQQRDNAKCGTFVLYYISLFMERAPENFSIYEGYPYFMDTNWFSEEGLESFCKQLDSYKSSLSSKMALALSFTGTIETEFPKLYCKAALKIKINGLKLWRHFATLNRESFALCNAWS